MESPDFFPYPKLFKELRNGLLWHCTSPGEFRQIQSDGYIRPNDGSINKWGGKYACQELGGVSLFDFSTRPESKVLESADRWRQFIGCAKPATIVLGLERSKLPGRLVPYPQNKEGTTGNIIPWVEICHCGPVPMQAIVMHLVICAADYSKFSKFPDLDSQSLTQAEIEIAEYSRIKAAAARPQMTDLHKIIERARQLVQEQLKRK